MLRNCIVPGCTNKVKSNAYFYCTKCYAEWAPTGRMPTWMVELKRVARHQERNIIQYNKHEIPSGLLLPGCQDKSSGGALDHEQLDWDDQVLSFRGEGDQKVRLRDSED